MYQVAAVARGAAQFGRILVNIARTGVVTPEGELHDINSANVDAPADVATMELRDGTFDFLDNYKGARTGEQRLFPAGTVLAGKGVTRA